METKKSAWGVALKYAIIVGLVSFIWSIIVYIAHWYLSSGIQWVGMIFLVGGLVLVMKERRDKELGGFMTFGEGFSAGFMFCMLLAVFSIVANFILTTAIAPEMMDEIMKHSEQQMIDKGMPQEQIDMGMKYAKMFMGPVAQAIIIVLFTAFFGAILSLIVAAIMKKNNPNLQAPQA